MKRLVPLLILAVFCLGIMGGRAVHFHHHLQKSAPTHHGLHIFLFPAFDDSAGDLDEADQPLAPSGCLFFFPEPCGHDLAAWDWANPTSQRDDNRQGLGCGGLPA